MQLWILTRVGFGFSKEDIRRATWISFNHVYFLFLIATSSSSSKENQHNHQHPSYLIIIRAWLLLYLCDSQPVMHNYVMLFTLIWSLVIVNLWNIFKKTYWFVLLSTSLDLPPSDPGAAFSPEKQDGLLLIKKMTMMMILKIMLVLSLLSPPSGTEYLL